MPLSPDDEQEALSITEALIERLSLSAATDGGRLAIVNSGDESMGRWLESVAAKRAIPYLDLSVSLLKGKAEGVMLSLPSDPHPSPEGHKIAAQSILRILRDENLLGSTTSE